MTLKTLGYLVSLTEVCGILGQRAVKTYQTGKNGKLTHSLCCLYHEIQHSYYNV